MNDRKHVSDFDGARVAREIARGHVTVLEGGGGGREGEGGRGGEEEREGTVRTPRCSCSLAVATPES